MRKEKILNILLEEKIISIVRLKNGDLAPKVIDNLVKGGIKVLEITSNTPNFDIQITAARKKHPDILIGAGTVTTPELAQIAIKAGAQFLVTPNTNRAIVNETIKASIPVVMGAFTPTETANAISYGADIIKLFPAGQMGISYYKSLKAPFSGIKFFAVGGIDLDNTEAWLDAGIDGLGLGSSLVQSEINTTEELNDIIIKAQQFKKLTN
ncbi:bifunctional 4-hydroxy-2-oxoglutarate aldolase/2-dehydro-3-deoxy-phosphogluconate aldolase [Algibacter sp. R77976]|uniref:bifunctional 4-hydroxy-2-oxoglutarate aldolase/2-dehydro-3-deoxy-phosphogluconate aldolase n=1 Tax=Algibacter sp. R77976 TaxID=3093873 RepID=UPI0037CC21DE